LLRSKSRGYTGIYPFLEALEEKRYKQYIRVFLRKYQRARSTAQPLPQLRCSLEEATDVVRSFAYFNNGLLA
jgi:hypothetical protein